MGILHIALATCLGMGWWFHPPPYAAEIQWSACRHHIDPRILAAIVRVESRYNAKALRREKKVRDWSVGLMQVRVGTAKWLGFHGDEFELMTPETNLRYGAMYLEKLVRRYGSGAISAYNAGKPCRCNQRYVSLVLKAKTDQR